jgi:chemotaxis protein methyltransferase CheR
VAAAREPVAEAVLSRLRQELAARAGLQLPDWVLRSRLQKRMTAIAAASAEEYVELICAPRGAGELAALLEAVRVGETRFFRHRAQVAALIDRVVPAIRERGPGPVRAWSAGCATGEEAYTAAMVLSRLLPRPSWQVSVLATDISDEALDDARTRRYGAGALTHVPEEWRDAFVREPDGTVRITDSVAALVDFQRHNLAEESYPRDLDLIWCRNVLIYFTPDARRRVVQRLVDSVRIGGHLFVGYSESLRDIAGVEAVRVGDAVVYRKLGAVPRRSATPAPGVRIAGGAAGGGAATARAAAAVAAPAAAAAPATRELPPAASGPAAAGTVRLALRGRYDDERRLMDEITSALGHHQGHVVIDLDGADLLGDSAAAVLRRARSAARAAGISVDLVASRPGPRRWLRRHGLGGKSGPMQAVSADADAAGSGAAGGRGGKRPGSGGEGGAR